MSNEKFKQIIIDFKKDLIATFPELSTSLNDLDVEVCYAHCSETYPKIFFDEKHFKVTEIIFVIYFL